VEPVMHPVEHESHIPSGPSAWTRPPHISGMFGANFTLNFSET
jgi:hypothetical protein